jgi:hypothetical protein
VVVAAALLLAAGGEVRAQSPDRVQVELVVSRISKRPGEIDPRASRIHAELSQEFRYESLKVVKSVRLNLGIDEVGGLALPNGKQVRVKPLLVDAKGVLLAVDVEGTLQTDLRVKSDQLVIIGAQRHKKDKLVISLELHF